MTSDSFESMDDQEQRDLAQRLAESYEGLSFDIALEYVKGRPARAREMLSMWEEMMRLRLEQELASKRRRRALIEDYG